MSVRNPSTPAEWAAVYRQEWKAMRRNRSDLEGLLARVTRTVADHEYWWTNKQRPELRGEINDLRIEKSKIEKDIAKLG